MRRSILASLMVAIVVATAQPAWAVDEGFQGRYRLIATHASGRCQRDGYRHPVYIRYVNERVRVLRHLRAENVRRLRHVRGERFPWQQVRGFSLVLRYDPATDSAVGFRHVPECEWRVRLVPIG